MKFNKPNASNDRYKHALLGFIARPSSFHLVNGYGDVRIVVIYELQSKLTFIDKDNLRGSL